MEAIGLTKQEDLKFPLYVIGEVTTIGQFDANGAVALNPDGTPVTAERLTARSVFKTKEAILQAHVDSKLLDVEIAQAISTEAKTAGLSETAINALLAVVI